MVYERRVQLLLTRVGVLRPRGARASEPLQPRRLPTAALLVLQCLHSGEEVGTGLARRC